MKYTVMPMLGPDQLPLEEHGGPWIAGGEVPLDVCFTTSSGARRLLRFLPGLEGGNPMTGVVPFPGSSSHVLALSRGQVFRMREIDGEIEIEPQVAPFPVFHALEDAERDAIILFDHTNAQSVGTIGSQPTWVSPRLSDGGFRDPVLVGDRITGIGWSAARERELRFTISAETGRLLESAEIRPRLAPRLRSLAVRFLRLPG